MLNDNEKKKYETINKLVNDEMTRKEAMDDLNLSRQQMIMSIFFCRFLLKYFCRKTYNFILAEF